MVATEIVSWSHLVRKIIKVAQKSTEVQKAQKKIPEVVFKAR